MINPLDLRPNVKPTVRNRLQRLWDKKQARIKKDELHELHVLLSRAENQFIMTPQQGQRLKVLLAKYKDEESPA